jgi:hypothetical protein
VPRRLRLRLFDMAVAKWLVPACRCLILPVAVNRNRFFVPLCVFCFGISLSPYGMARQGGEWTRRTDSPDRPATREAIWEAAYCKATFARLQRGVLSFPTAVRTKLPRAVPQAERRKPPGPF